MRDILFCILASFGFFVYHGFSPRIVHATVISILNLDEASEGFNDSNPPDSASTMGGNNGATIGAQRLIAFQRAADIWANILSSPVEIIVDANFDPLTCSNTSAVLGSAGTKTIHRDFAGAPLANTWYPQALANSLAGADVSPGTSDIQARFNSAIGTTCAFPLVWYYGLDGNPPAGTLDLLSVVLHELGHGLGFQSFIDLPSGTKFFDFNDVFSNNLEDHSTGKIYPLMTDAERVSASQNSGNLHWIGPNVVAASGNLTAGVDPNGHVQMFAPSPQQTGSSVSHFDTAVTPNELMEPSYTGVTHDVGLTMEVFADLGWAIALSAQTKADYDGDGKSDVAIFRNGIWYDIRSSDGELQSVGLGMSGDEPVPADYDGDGKLDRAIFRNGIWYYFQSSDGTLVQVGLGTSGDVPVPADFDGDGKADTAIFRNGIWYYFQSSNGALVQVGLGTAGDIAVPADYDGDGKTDPAIVRNGIWYIRQSSNGVVVQVGLGTAGDIVAPADYDGDGKTDPAVFRNGLWFIRQSSNGVLNTVGLGTAGDVPVPADYDGDGRADPAIFRNGIWYIRQSSNGVLVQVGLGTTGDVPVN